MSTIVLLYLFGYLPFRPLPPGFSSIAQYSSYDESVDRDPYGAEDSVYTDTNTHQQYLSQATRRAHQPDHHSWWENDSSPHAEPTSFFDFNASR